MTELSQGFSSCCCPWKGSSELPWHFPDHPCPAGFPCCPCPVWVCCARSWQCRGAIPRAIPWECAHLAVPSWRDCLVTQAGTLGDQDVEVAPGWHWPGQGGAGGSGVSTCQCLSSISWTNT